MRNMKQKVNEALAGTFKKITEAFDEVKIDLAAAKETAMDRGNIELTFDELFLDATKYFGKVLFKLADETVSCPEVTPTLILEGGASPLSLVATTTAEGSSVNLDWCAEILVTSYGAVKLCFSNTETCIDDELSYLNVLKENIKNNVDWLSSARIIWMRTVPGDASKYIGEEEYVLFSAENESCRINVNVYPIGETKYELLFTIPPCANWTAVESFGNPAEDIAMTAIPDEIKFNENLKRPARKPIVSENFLYGGAFQYKVLTETPRPGYRTRKPRAGNAGKSQGADGPGT